MKPKWEPIAFPRACALYGETPFQPLVLPDLARLVAGGPSALFVFQLYSRAELTWTIPARDRITGFVAHGGEMFVQDGPVLSRWSLLTGECGAAINVLFPDQRWNGSGTLDWAALHTLPANLVDRRKALERARRRVEWGALLIDAEQELLDLARVHPSLRPADVYAQLDQMVKDLKDMLGVGLDGAARAALSKATDEGGALIFSAPVVRTHQIRGKKAGIVFVINREGKLYPLDDKFTVSTEDMNPFRLHPFVQPALALAEFATDSDSDDFACRLYYVAPDGTVPALDGGALPVTVLPSWPARGAGVDLEPRLRPRVVDDLVWGAGAQGTGIFALTVDRPGEPSRVTLPAGDWRWLEIRPNWSLALASGDSGARLIAYGKGVRTADRWGPRPSGPPCFSTFLPESTAPPDTKGRPLLVLEVNREPLANADLAFRVMVANTADTPRPVPPAELFSGTLDAWSARIPGPKTVRTQPSVSRQDTYLVAGDQTRTQRIQALLGANGPWRRHHDQIKQRYPNPTAALGEIGLPPITGRDLIFCYPIGNAIKSEQAASAWRAVDALNELATPVRLLLTMSHVTWIHANPSRVAREGDTEPMRSRDVTLRFGNGKTLTTRTGSDGWVTLEGEFVGETVTADSPWRHRKEVTTCRLGRSGENRIHTKTYDP